MSLPQVRAFMAAGERRERRRLLNAAMAARMAQADARTWQRFVRDLQD